MGSMMITRSLRKKEIPHCASRVNTPTQLAAMTVASPLGALTLAFALARWRRRQGGRGRVQEVRRQLGVGSNDPDQHLVILGATAIRFKPSHERQGVFGAQIDLLEILEEFEVSKHDGLHSGGPSVGR